MPGRLSEWNVVVLGSWNVAILTPKGIARRLLQLEDVTPIQVSIAVDSALPPRVIHNDSNIEVSNSRILISSNDATAANLAASSNIAVRALSSLPETPVTAAGVNLIYTFASSPIELADLVTSSCDDLLTDAGYRWVSRLMRRTISLEPGIINIDICDNADLTSYVSLNFHCENHDPEILKSWLNRIDEMLSKARHLLTEVFRLHMEDQ